MFWSSGNAFVTEARSLRCKSQTGQIGKVSPMASHRLDISSKEAVFITGAMMRRWALPTRYTLQRNTASIMKDLILVWYKSSLFVFSVTVSYTVQQISSHKKIQEQEWCPL